MKKVVYLSLTLLLTTLLIECKEATTDFSPGVGDSRITGTWRLVERLFPVDVRDDLIDSVFVPAHYKIDSTLVNGQYIKDTVFVKDGYVKDTIIVVKSIDVLRKYSASIPQTLTFGADGKLGASGDTMSYYYPIKYYKVDTTYPDSLGINFYITTNRATVYFKQGLKFKGDTLLFLPRCERNCYSKFVRAR
ncbi:hypothetical protein GCM10028805_05630 [Spirosoma harenae]